MKKSLAILCFLTAVLAPIPAAAEETAVLTSESVGGPSIGVGETITGTLNAGTAETFSTGPGSGISCTSSSFTATVETNPAAGGVATTSTTSWNHSGCITSGMTGVVGVRVASTALPYGTAFNGATGAVSLIKLRPTKTITLLTVIGPVTCVYVASSTTTMTYFNASGTLVIRIVTYTKISGPALCPSTLTYSSAFILRWRTSPIFLN